MKIIDRDKEHKCNTTQSEKMSRVREQKFPELQSFQPRNARSSLNFLQNAPSSSLNSSSSNGTWKILTRWNKVNSNIKMGKFIKAHVNLFIIHFQSEHWRFYDPCLISYFSKTKLLVSSLKITMYSEPLYHRGLVILHWQLPQCQFISIILW